MTQGPYPPGAGEDALAISNVISRFSHLVDARDFVGIGDLFADMTYTAVNDESGQKSEPIQGRQAIIDFFEKSAAFSNVQWLRSIDSTADPADVGTRHVFTNLLIEVAPDRKTARATYYGTSFAFAPGTPPRARYAGRYIDSFERRESGWTIVERLQIHDFAPTLESSAGS